MPNVLGNKIQVQNDIGHRILSNEENRHHLDYLLNAGGNDDSFYRIIDKDSIEIVESHHDRFPCLNCRKAIMMIRVYINRTAVIIITNSIFESISIMVIVANSIFLALDDPLAEDAPVY